MQRSAAVRQRAPDAEDKEEALGDSGRRAAYSIVTHIESLREEVADLQGFVLAQEHQFLVEVYGDHLHHNDVTHLDEVVDEDAMCQWHWRTMATQLAIWYTTLPRAIVRRLTLCLVEEWKGDCKMRCNSERPLVFVHIIFTKNPGMRQAKEIRARIYRRLDLFFDS